MPSEIHLKGDWRKIRHLTNEIEKTPQMVEDVIMPEIVDKTTEALKVVVSSNPPPPNSPVTLKKPYKKGKGTLEETGAFKSNIVSDEYKERGRTIYVIHGSDSPQARTRTSYKDLLGILDEGSSEKNIPARNLLKSAYDLVDEEIKYIVVTQLSRLFK